MSLYSAIDLHSNNGVLAVIDEDDRVVLERRLPNELPVILKALEPFREELVGVAVESTYNWYWLVDGLLDHGHRPRLVNTAAVPQYAGLKFGNDHSDARHLAQLMRLKILPEGYIYPRPQRALRDLLRQRFRLVQQSTRLIHGVQCAWSRRNGGRLCVDTLRGLNEEQLMRVLIDPCERLAVQSQIAVWKVLQQQVRQVEKAVLLQLEDVPALRAVQTTPGIGRVLGATILLESGPIERFAAVGDYASYARMVQSIRLSNGKPKGKGNVRCGNRYLAWAYMEAANFAIRYNPDAARWYQRKLAKRPLVLARKALAHKLARACYFLMRDGGTFDSARLFG